MAETAFQLLKGIASKYSNDNLLQFLRRDVEFVPQASEILIGSSSNGTDVDVVAENLQEVKNVYCKIGEEWNELDFVSYEDFPDSQWGSFVYSWQPLSDTFGKIYLKDGFVADGRTLKVVYNVAWDFDINSTLYVPSKYIELFNCALAHRLALNFPRLSSEQVAMMKAELDELVENVRTTTRANKMILHKGSGRGMSYNDFLAGRFL